jgi:hypothetical protein
MPRQPAIAPTVAGATPNRRMPLGRERFHTTFALYYYEVPIYFVCEMTPRHGNISGEACAYQ